MLRSKWVVETHVYDYFDYNRRYSHKQKSFSSLVEAFAYYKEEKAYDVEWDDHSQKTKISHIFVYENEDKIKQETRREEKRRKERERAIMALDAELEEWYQKKKEEEDRLSKLESEYVFDPYAEPDF